MVCYIHIAAAVAEVVIVVVVEVVAVPIANVEFIKRVSVSQYFIFLFKHYVFAQHLVVESAFFISLPRWFYCEKVKSSVLFNTKNRKYPINVITIEGKY